MTNILLFWIFLAIVGPQVSAALANRQRSSPPPVVKPWKEPSLGREVARVSIFLGGFAALFVIAFALGAK